MSPKQRSPPSPMPRLASPDFLLQELFGLPFLVRCPPRRSTRYLWRLVVQQASRFVAGSSGSRGFKAGSRDRMAKAAAGARWVVIHCIASPTLRWAIELWKSGSSRLSGSLEALHKLLRCICNPHTTLYRGGTFTQRGQSCESTPHGACGSWCFRVRAEVVCQDCDLVLQGAVEVFRTSDGETPRSWHLLRVQALHRMDLRLGTGIALETAVLLQNCSRAVVVVAVGSSSSSNI